MPLNRFAHQLQLMGLVLGLAQPSLTWSAPIDEAGKPELPAPVDSNDEQPQSSPTENRTTSAIEMPEWKQAREALIKGNVPLCQEMLRAAYARQPTLPPPKVMHVRLLFELNQFTAARQILEAAAAANPGHPEIHLLFGQLALMDGRISDAAVHFEKVENMSPDDWTQEQKRNYYEQCLLGRSMVAELRHDWSEASRLLQERLRSQPNDAQLRDQWASILFQAGNLDLAFEQFDIAYRQNKAVSPPEVSMGVMCARNGRHTESDAWFEKAMQKHPEEPAVYFHRSVTLMSRGDSEEAESYAAKADALGMRDSFLLLHRGRLALQRGDLKQAEAFLRAVLEDSPNDFTATFTLALALVEQDNDAKRAQALELARSALQSQANSADALAVLGWVYFRNDQPEKAELLLRDAVARAPGDLTSQYFLARVLFQQGKQDEARQYAQRLRMNINQPGQFLFRSSLQKWLETVSDGG